MQLTWLDNYRRSSADAVVDLVANPDAMLNPVISARVLVKGLIDGRWNGQGKGVSHYLPGDPVQARRTVNVLDKAQEIAGYYRQFLAALDKAGWQAVERQPQVTVGKPHVNEKPKSEHDGGNMLTRALAALVAWITGKGK